MIISSFVASTARAIVETPLELIKVRLQVGTKWNYGSLFQGFGVTWVRTIGLMTNFFVYVILQIDIFQPYRMLL